jgi:hypothetical protein
LEKPFLLSQPKQNDDATRETRIVKTILGKEARTPMVMTRLRQRVARKIEETKEK